MSYTFPTATATATTQTLPVQNDVSGVTLTVEFSYHKGFANVASSKPVTGSGKTVTLSLSGGEVDSLKSTYYRIKSVKGGVTEYITDGVIQYNPQTAHDVISERLLPSRLSDANLRTEFSSATSAANFATKTDVSNVTAAVQTETSRAIAAELPPSGIVVPSFYNMKAWSFDPAFMSTATAMVSGQATLTAVQIPQSISASNIIVAPSSVTSTVFTAGQNAAAILKSDGTILAQTGDLTTTLATITPYDRQRLSLTGGPVTITGGPGVFVYVLFMVNFTGTAPSYAGLGGVNTTATNIALSADNPTGKYRSAYASPVITAIPASPVGLTSAKWGRRQQTQWVAID